MQARQFQVGAEFSEIAIQAKYSKLGRRTNPEAVASDVWDAAEPQPQ
jgi:hypothetical protein